MHEQRRQRPGDKILPEIARPESAKRKRQKMLAKLSGKIRRNLSNPPGQVSSVAVAQRTDYFQ